MRAVVVGGGTWGTGFARLLADRAFDVTLAVRDAEVARAIRETGRNPRYSTSVDLRGIGAATIEDAPFAGTELAVVAVPSRAFRAVVEALPGNAPVLSLTKGLDPETGERLSTLRRSGVRRAGRHRRPTRSRAAQQEQCFQPFPFRLAAEEASKLER